MWADIWDDIWADIWGEPISPVAFDDGIYFLLDLGAGMTFVKKIAKV